MATWQDLEANVRVTAATIWGKKFHSIDVHGRQIDCYSDLGNGKAVAIEVTEVKDIKKIQDDINKLIHVRNVNFSTKYIHTECVCVTSYEPTPAMKNVGSSLNIDVISASEFQSKFLPFDEYDSVRSVSPFGSAIEPETGDKDKRNYVLVGLINANGGEFDAIELSRKIKSGDRIVLIGEYGTGKSKCIEKVYSILSDGAWGNLSFPMAIDLRKCWGLKDRYEIINRHMKDFGLGERADSFEKAYNSGSLILLLDGFDELGVQVWSEDSSTLKALRADALAGVRDLIANQRGGILICGREHYFDSRDEMLSALGLINSSPIMLRTKDEFTHEEIDKFLELNGNSSQIPLWLPRKPLTCEFFLRVLSDVDADIADELDLVQFWDLLIGAVCAREARIHPSFDVETIKGLLVEVASSTRMKSENVGPISLAEIQSAFERVVGHAPIEQASVLLQRLPGLGRAAADSDDRRFVDTYLLGGLRAQQVVDSVNRRDNLVDQDSWVNPLDENSLLICGRKFSSMNMIDEALAFCKAKCSSKNKTLLLDVICSIIVSGEKDIDFGGIYCENGSSSVVDLSGARISNIHINEALIDKLVISGASIENIKISNSAIGNLEGISSPSARPIWVDRCSIDNYSSVATISRIKAANLSAGHKVLVTIIRKIFFQKGAARKEEALLRGLGNLVKQGTLDKIINKLISEGLATKEKGDAGAIYVPNRSHTRRAAKIISELSLSKDQIWMYISGL